MKLVGSIWSAFLTATTYLKRWTPSSIPPHVYCFRITIRWSKLTPYQSTSKLKYLSFPIQSLFPSKPCPNLSKTVNRGENLSRTAEEKNGPRRVRKAQGRRTEAYEPSIQGRIGSRQEEEEAQERLHQEPDPIDRAHAPQGIRKSSRNLIGSDCASFKLQTIRFQLWSLFLCG